MDLGAFLCRRFTRGMERLGPNTTRTSVPGRLGIVAAIIAAFCVAGCSERVDSEQARVCRVAAVALFDDPGLGVVAQRPLAPDTALTQGVRIDIEGGSSSGPVRWIECRFSHAGGDPVADLDAVSTSDGPLSEARLLVLKRFWLASEEGAAADPLPSQVARDLPSVPRGVAYAAQQGLNALPDAAVYGLLAAAYSLVYGLYGRINLAFGELAATGGFAAFIAAALTEGADPLLRFGLAAIAGLWSAALHGVAVERLVLWPLRRSTGQQGLVATIGVALFLQEYLRLTQGTGAKWIGSMLDTPLALASAEGFVVTVTPIALLIAAGAALTSAILLALLRFSRFGREWRATSDDPIAAALFGVDPKRLSLTTFVVASALVGLAGASVTVFFGGLGFVYTTTLGLKALIAAIVGGIGSVPGAFLGGVAIALIEAAWSAYLPIVYRDLVVDVLLVGMLVFRPGGFFGYRDLLPRRV